MKCPSCHETMVIVMAEEMGHSYWCGKCKHVIDYDFDKGRAYIDGVESRGESFYPNS